MSAFPDLTVLDSFPLKRTVIGCIGVCDKCDQCDQCESATSVVELGEAQQQVRGCVELLFW